MLMASPRLNEETPVALLFGRSWPPYRGAVYENQHEDPGIENQPVNHPPQ